MHLCHSPKKKALISNVAGVVLNTYVLTPFQNAQTSTSLHATKPKLPIHHNMPQDPNKAVAVFRHIKKDSGFCTHVQDGSSSTHINIYKVEKACISHTITHST